MPPPTSQSMPSLKLHPMPDEVASPCVSVCAIDPVSGLCVGCYRTLDEIATWIELDTSQRLAVRDAIAERRKIADAHR